MGALFAPAARADAATITVCNAGCTFPNSLQSAINAAGAGDVILLQSGFTYVGTFTLKQFSCVANDQTCYVTIRTGVSATGTILSTSLFPAPNMRIGPSYASVLAKIQSDNDSTNPINTEGPPAVAKWWRLQWLEVVARPAGLNYLIRLGNDSRATQATAADIPGPFSLVQIYVHGDPVKGQFRGIGVHARGVTLQDSYVSDIKSQAEGQAVWINSTDDAGTYVNNYIEGGTEVFFMGGSAGCCRPVGVTVLASPAPSTTSARLSSVVDLTVGKGITVQIGGVEQYTEIASISGTDVTFSPALTASPDVGGAVEWGLTPSNLVVQKNTITRPIAWRSPIVGTPQSVSATAISSGGSLGIGTFSYRVVARLATASGQVARSTASVEVSATTTSGSSNSVRISWAAVTNAETYYIYGRSLNGENVRFSVNAPTTTFTDTGGSGTAENVPTTSGSTWQVKNTFEMKNVDTALIEGNIIENSWVAGQSGYLFLLTPANTGTGNPSTHVANVTFRNNIVRHGAGGFQITGRDVGTNAIQPSGRTRNISITNNLWQDINTSTYGGGSVRTAILTTNYNSSYANAGDTLAPLNLTIEHNTFDHTNGNAFLYLDLFKNSTAWHVNNFVYRNNIAYKLSFGLTGNGSCTQGSGCWNAYTSGTSPFTNNVIADASCSVYPNPSGNFCPTAATLQGYYANYALGDLSLRSTSPYHNSATDKTDIGAIIPTITAFTNIAASGDNSGAPPAVSPQITTASLPNGSLGNPYSVTLAAANCGTACTWTITVGVLPDGLALSTNGVISGAPTVAATEDFTVKATNSSGLTDTQDFTLSVIGVAADITDRPTRVDYVENATFVRAAEPTVDDDKLRVGDVWIDLTSGCFKWAASTSPTVVWNTLLTSSGSCGSVNLTNLNASNLTSGTVPIARLGTSGTPSNVNFLRGDGAWAIPAGGGTSTVITDIAFFYAASTGYSTWNLTAGTTTELFGATRNRKAFDLTGFSTCRIYARVATAVAGVTVAAYPQYSTDNGTSWNDLGLVAQTPAIDLTTTAGMSTSGWQNIVPGAKADVVLRLVATAASGSITTQPMVGNVGMNCK
jgi:hypothetical protein